MKIELLFIYIFQLQVNHSQSFLTIDNQPVNENKQKIVSRKLFELKLKNKLTKKAIQDFLDFNKFQCELFNIENCLPKTYHKLESASEFDELNYDLGFYCKNCESNVLISKDVKICECGNDINFRDVLDGDHFYSFDLIQQLQFILENKDLKDNAIINEEYILNYTDGIKYSELLQMKINDRILTLQFFFDGVTPQETQSFGIWTGFYKLLELNGKEDDKIFLLCCFKGSNYPDIHFFLDKIVQQLNYLYDNGIYVSKIDKIVYPLALNCLLDLPAKALFLNHKLHNGENGCPTCEHPGVSLGRGKRIYKPIYVRTYKNKSIYRRKTLPYKGMQNLIFIIITILIFNC